MNCPPDDLTVLIDDNIVLQCQKVGHSSKVRVGKTLLEIRVGKVEL